MYNKFEVSNFNRFEVGEGVPKFKKSHVILNTPYFWIMIQIRMSHKM